MRVDRRNGEFAFGISENFGQRPVRATYAGSLAGRCMSVFWQLAREKSLVPKCSGMSGNSSENSKGMFQNDIRKFETSRPSQPVRSLPTVSGLQKCARHSRHLPNGHAALEAQFSGSMLPQAGFGRQSLVANFQYPCCGARDSVRSRVRQVRCFAPP
jgi:hypothetical protein